MAEATEKKRKLWISLLVVCCGLLIAAVVIFLRLGSRLDDIGKSRFGIQKLALPNGRELYAKREVRGQNFDVVALSLNSSACTSANPERDLIFRYDGNPLMISTAGNTLLVFRSGGYEQPKQKLPDVEVKPVPLGSTASEVASSEKVQSIEIPLQFVRRGANRCEKQ